MTVGLQIEKLDVRPSSGCRVSQMMNCATTCHNLYRYKRSQGFVIFFSDMCVPGRFFVISVKYNNNNNNYNRIYNAPFAKGYKAPGIITARSGRILRYKT